ncbi:MAG: tRNA-dihydrouridine synthase family protein [bacterium]|nr:tRNA-dihydrouridine synthase family protein [bacterium]
MSQPWTAKVILAPMSKGSNLPFRRLCSAFGTQATMSEMVFATALAKGSRRDIALMRKHPDEQLFGAQILAAQPEAAVQAALTAQEMGVDWVDLNAGCPIREALSKGCGARLLERPQHLRAVCSALASNLHIPVTVKLRSGPKASRLNYLETSALAEEAGVSAIAIHGRDREQRYTGCADWDVVKNMVAARSVPIIGNGDILTWYEAEDRLQQSGAFGIMIGRGALIKPWIFQELKEKRDLNPTPEERLEVYLRLAAYMLEHFGDDERGFRTAHNFLTWHGDFFCRYRYLPEQQYREQSRQHPLIQTRSDMPSAEDDPLNFVLAVQKNAIHAQIAQIILEAAKEGRTISQLCEQIAGLKEECLELLKPRPTQDISKLSQLSDS